MMRLREVVPGSQWLMRCLDDLHWWHERVFAWPITNTRWVVRTGDGDQFNENLGQQWQVPRRRFLGDSLEKKCKNV